MTALRRVIRECDELLLYECAYCPAIGPRYHVDVHIFETGDYLGIWSIEGQKAFDGLELTFQLIACLEQLGYKVPGP